MARFFVLLFQNGEGKTIEGTMWKKLKKYDWGV
jgi:hypothetical protein